MSSNSAADSQKKTSRLLTLAHGLAGELADQAQDEVASTLTYQQVLDELRMNKNRYDFKFTNLIVELVKKEKRLGEINHPDVADALTSVAYGCRCRGKYREAEALSRRALEICEAVHGTNHLIVARQLEALALSCQRQEKYQKAEPYYQRAIAILETKLAVDNLRIAQVKEPLASCYFQHGKYKEAEELYKQVLEIYKLEYGPDHFQVTIAEMQLDHCKKYIEAEELKIRKQGTTLKRTSDAIDADDKSINSQGHAEAKTAKVNNTVDGPRATVSVALAETSTPVPASSSDEVVPKESLSFMDRVVADARAKIMAEIDGITEMNNISHLNLKQRIEELHTENADQNEKLREANRKIEDLMCSQSSSKQIIARLRTKLNKRAQRLRSSEEMIEDLESSRQATLEKSARLEAEISDKAQRLLEAKATIETSERTIAELKAEIAEKSSQLAEAKRTIESHLSCSICKDKDANRMWSECHHVATCEHCATKLLRRDGGKSGNGVTCPICQTLGFPLKVFI